jgi:hypothetical protein
VGPVPVGFFPDLRCLAIRDREDEPLSQRQMMKEILASEKLGDKLVSVHFHWLPVSEK